MIFLSILNGLSPSFLMVALGGLLRKRLSENAWQGLDKLNFEILFPALIFVAASGRPVSVSQVVTIAPLVWAILIAGLAIGFLARRFGPERFLDFAGCWQTAWRFNTAIGFVAVGTLSGSGLAIFAVVVGMAVPMANVFAVLALTKDGHLGFLNTVKKILFNPFLIASLSGAFVAMTGIVIPALIMAPIEMVAAAAIPVALISIGATMNWAALGLLDRFTGILNATKLMILPMLVVIAGLLLGASGDLISVLVVFAATPTASAAHVLASGFGADRKKVATLVAQSTLLAAFTLPLWIAVAELLF